MPEPSGDCLPEPFIYDHTHAFLSREWVRSNFKQTTEDAFVVARKDGYEGHLWGIPPRRQFLVHNPDGVGVFVFAHQELLRRYVQDRRHLDGITVKSYRRIVRDLGGLMTRATIRSNMAKLFPEIALEIRRQHTTPIP
jgi:hypothetical protein